MKVYMIEGFDLTTGRPGVIGYAEADSKAEACKKFEEDFPNHEVNEILDVLALEDFADVIDHVKEMAYENLDMQSCGEEDLVGFEFNGVHIVNPWVDETGRFDLSDEEAVKLYGLYNVLQFICNIIEC